MVRFILGFALAASLSLPAWSQDVPASEPIPRSDVPPANQPAPRSDSPAYSRSQGESSSRDTKIDLSPPPGERGLDLGGGTPASDVQELKPWDPHKAEKNVEVGDYYLLRKNYAAAISRYREALYWKSNDAIASIRLAKALEEAGDYTEARKYYQAYLSLLPRGEYAKQAAEALTKLKDKQDNPQKAAGVPNL